MSDAIEMRFRAWAWWCGVCRCYVTDPENHRYHAVFSSETFSTEKPEDATNFRIGMRLDDRDPGDEDRG